jgi:hypothetical protein
MDSSREPAFPTIHLRARMQAGILPSSLPTPPRCGAPEAPSPPGTAAREPCPERGRASQATGRIGSELERAGLVPPRAERGVWALVWAAGKANGARGAAEARARRYCLVSPFFIFCLVIALQRVRRPKAYRRSLKRAWRGSGSGVWAATKRWPGADRMAAK